MTERVKSGTVDVLESKQRFCKDCKWFLHPNDEDGARCVSPDLPLDPVTGDFPVVDCRDNRSPYGECGPGAKLFEAKPDDTHVCLEAGESATLDLGTGIWTKEAMLAFVKRDPEEYRSSIYEAAAKEHRRTRNWENAMDALHYNGVISQVDYERTLKNDATEKQREVNSDALMDYEDCLRSWWERWGI